MLHNRKTPTFLSLPGIALSYVTTKKLPFQGAFRVQSRYDLAV
jgi:hypothetical protein